MNKKLLKNSLALLLLSASTGALAQGGAATRDDDCVVAPALTPPAAVAVEAQNKAAPAARERRYAMESPRDSSWPNAGLGKVGGSMPAPGITAPGG